MIKNIVFDMGNVLVDYTADGVCRHFIEDPETRKKVSTSGGYGLKKDAGPSGHRGGAQSGSPVFQPLA